MSRGIGREIWQDQIYLFILWNNFKLIIFIHFNEPTNENSMKVPKVGKPL